MTSLQDSFVISDELQEKGVGTVYVENSPRFNKKVTQKWMRDNPKQIGNLATLTNESNEKCISLIKQGHIEEGKSEFEANKIALQMRIRMMKNKRLGKC